MAIPTVALNEDSPAGGDYIRSGDNKICEFKTQNREILEVDHVYPSSGQDDTCGMHKQVSLIEAADIGTGASGKPLLGGQTVSGKPELVYTDEDDNDIQLTSGGKLHSAVDGLSAGLKEAIFNFVYPVGKVVTLGVSTNPNTLWGFGTWTAIAGKVIVGINAGDAEFDTLNETGGAKTVTLTAAESGLPAHNHRIGTNNANDGEYALNIAGTLTGEITNGPLTATNAAANASSAHNNLQPYIVKYVWQRTA